MRVKILSFQYWKIWSLCLVILCAFVCMTACHNVPAPQASPAVPLKPTIIIAPGDGTSDFDPTAPVAVTSFNAELYSVDMQDLSGKKIKGTFSLDKHSWKPDSQLEYNHQYTLSAYSVSPNKDASALSETSNFHTAVPQNKTRVYFRSSGNSNLIDGATYGVGEIIVAHFDEPIANKALAQRYLSIKTTPAVTGAWYWTDDQNAHWRPEKFYSPGTKITATANIYGQELAKGLYGEMNTSIHLIIGPKHYSIADDNTHQVKVYDDGKLIRTMPTSMGVGGYVKGKNGLKVSLYTPSGIYTVLGRENPVIMDSSTFGLPVHSRLGYREAINYATLISNDGIYLHELDTTVWAQGNTDTSHGCLNLNKDNAKWFYDWALEGDPVEIVHTGGPKLKQWQNGDWSIPWKDWLKGSALK